MTEPKNKPDPFQKGQDWVRVIKGGCRVSEPGDTFRDQRLRGEISLDEFVTMAAMPREIDPNDVHDVSIVLDPLLVQHSFELALSMVPGAVSNDRDYYFHMASLVLEKTSNRVARLRASEIKNEQESVFREAAIVVGTLILEGSLVEPIRPVANA